MLTKIKTKGFTILEVIVAIFVITIGVISAFNMVQNLSMFSRVNSSRFTATYLAQEGIELVRNERDDNWLQGDAWDDIDMGLIECKETDILGKFDRHCTAVTTGPEMNVSVTVEWSEIGTPHSVTNATKLYNWLSPP